MHILATLVAVIGVLLVVLWRMQQAANAARDIASAADDARGLFRRWKWQRKANVNPIDLIDDPREAATAMMVAVAQADGPISEREREAITAAAVRHFEATPLQADELLARGRWLVKDGVDAGEVFRRLAPMMRKTCAAEQRRDLVGMLRAVAAADGRRSEVVDADIASLERALAG